MRRHYPWVISGTALFVLFITNGLIIGGLSVFDESLLKTFGWSRGSLKFRDFLTFAIAGVLGPFVGTLADRYGVRRLMLGGAALLIAGIVLYSRVSSLAGIYGIHVLFALVLASCGLIVCVILVSRWFEKRRGIALGITLIGTSLGGFVFPRVGAHLIVHLGWRNAFLAEALFPVALVAVILLLVKETPEAMGLEPLGAPPPGGEQETTAGGVPYGAALRTGTFWALALTAMMTFYSILGVSQHLFLHLRGQGFDPLAASSGIGSLFLMGLVGKFLFGALADVFDRKRVFLSNLAIMFVGSLFLSSMREDVLWPFLILFGVGWGGLYTLLQVLTVESFGLRAAGKILGTITVLDALGGGLGPWITGVLYDVTGSYRVPFVLISILIFLALLAATQVRASATLRTTSSNG